MPTSLDTYAPFDAGAGSSVTEATWRDFMRHMLGSASGVIRGFLNEFAVTGDGSGMNVKVDTGECWMRGHYGKSTAIKTLSIAAAHATLPRKDRVVLRGDFTNNRVEVDVLTGTAAASPITPAVTQSTTIWETSLAVVDIPAADTAIAASQVTDDRVFTTASAKFIRTAALGGTQSIATNAFTKMVINQPVYRAGDVSVNAAFTDWTLQRSGLWAINARCTFPANAAGARQIEINDSDDPLRSFARLTVAAVGTINMHMTVTATDRHVAGQRINATAYQNSSAALALDAMDITLTWIGP